MEWVDIEDRMPEKDWCEIPEFPQDSPVKRIKPGEEGEILREVNGKIGWVREEKKDVV